MKLPFRLLWTLLCSHRRPSLEHPLDTCVTPSRVMPTDIDLFGHMNNGRYLMLMDIARADFGMRLGLLGPALRHRWLLPIDHATLDFHRELGPLEAFEIHTDLLGWDERRFYFRHRFRLAEDDQSATNQGAVTESARDIGVGHVSVAVRGPEGGVSPSTVIETIHGAPLASPPVARELLERLDPRQAAPKANQPTPGRPSPASEREPIAIVGIGCRLPGQVDSPDSLWEMLRDGRNGIVDVPASRWNPAKFHDPQGAPGRTHVQRAGLLDQDLQRFDAAFFGITPREAVTLDPQQRLLLETSWEAFEDAGIPAGKLAGSRTGVFVGGFMTDNLILRSNPYNRRELTTHAATSSTLTMLSNRLSYFYDLRGPSFSVDTACSSSLVAVHQACRSIWSGESDQALVGGVNAILMPEVQATMSKGGFLSDDGQCKTFDSRANGYVRAEGASLVVLKPLSQALADEDRIYATIRGSAVNQDGRTNGITLPNPDAQVDVMRDAYRDAGVSPSTISYVEAHGTGTAAGDPLEARALGRVVGAGRSPEQACLVGSIKTNLGHLEAAAGVTGLIRAALVLDRGEVPPHLHLEQLNPDIDLEANGLRVTTTPEALPEALLEDRSRHRAAVNAFGYGGTNAHVILEEAPSRHTPATEPRKTSRPLMLPLSARSPEALDDLAADYARRLGQLDKESTTVTPLDLCHSAATRREHHHYRLAAQGADAAELIDALTQCAHGQSSGDTWDSAVAQRDPGLVFVYTGMGPQWWAMGRQLMEAEPVFRQTLEACDRAFTRISGWSILDELLADEEDSKMHRTDIAQPANAALQVGLTELWRSWGVTPDLIIGHSIGEVGAAYACGALSLEETLTVAYHRSRLQARTAGQGTMLAIGLGADEAADYVAPHADEVAIAAINSRDAVTLAGQRAALEEIAERLESEKIFNKFLRVEVPYHSPVMDALEDELRSALADLRPRTPSIPTVSTVTGERVDADMLHDADYWWRNVRQSVRFADGLETALGLGANIFVEVGPHPVLASSIRSVVRDSETDAQISPTLVRKKDEMATITRTTRRLWTAGVEIDWDAYLGGGRHVKLPTYPWQREHHWTESIRSERHRLDRSDHPFLMTPQTSAHPTWETEINLAHMPWLADHVVAGSNLFPGAGYVEAFTAVHHALALRDDEQPGVGCTLEDITFDQPVLLRPGANAVVSLETAADTKKIVAYQQVDQTSWQPCASAKHYPRHRRAERVDLDAVEARLSDEMSPDALYDRLGERGLVYGPSFRAVGSLLHGKDEVLARLELPESVATGTDALEDYYLHPVLLDAGFHSLIAAALQREDASDRELVPVSVASVTVFEHASCEHTAQRLIAHGRLTELDDRRLRGDITLCTEAGEVVAIVEDFTCKALQRQQAVFDERFESWTYAQNWHPLPQQAPADAGPTRWLLLGAEPGLTADTPDSEDTWVAVDDLAELEQHLLEQHLLEQHL
ncbi:MAG: beta-ketoacyl synthase N-terminal-like domain-containing protein, partial [Persicimonas sp.]